MSRIPSAYLASALPPPARMALLVDPCVRHPGVGQRAACLGYCDPTDDPPDKVRIPPAVDGMRVTWR